MGCRGVITSPSKREGLYLHWGGSLENVLALAKICKELGYRDPERDATYALACITAIAKIQYGLFSETGVGVGAIDHIDVDNGDNGTYVIGKDWEIIERYGIGSEPNQTPDESEVEEIYQDLKEKLAVLRGK